MVITVAVALSNLRSIELLSFTVEIDECFDVPIQPACVHVLYLEGH